MAKSTTRARVIANGVLSEDRAPETSIAFYNITYDLKGR